MRKHFKEGRGPAKVRRRKTVMRKRPNAVKAAGHHRGSSVAGQETAVARLNRELNEALEQQAAITDILRVISNSPADVQPVLELGSTSRGPHLRGADCRYRRRR